MNKLAKLNAWSDKTAFSTPRSAQGYLRGGMTATASSCGSSCGAEDDKPKATACGASDDK